MCKSLTIVEFNGIKLHSEGQTHSASLMHDARIAYKDCFKCASQIQILVNDQRYRLQDRVPEGELRLIIRLDYQDRLNDLLISSSTPAPEKERLRSVLAGGSQPTGGQDVSDDAGRQEVTEAIDQKTATAPSQYLFPRLPLSVP